MFGKLLLRGGNIRYSVKSKIWLEYEGKPILGIGRYNLLKEINKTNSLKDSAKKIGVCQKTAYNYIKKMEAKLGKRIIESHKGGKNGGGYVSLSPIGLELLKKFGEICK